MKQEKVFKKAVEASIHAMQQVMVKSFIRCNSNVDIIFVLVNLIMVIIYICILAFPIIAIIRYSGFCNIINILSNSKYVSVMKLSFQTSLVSALCTFLLGTPTVFFILSRKNSILTKILDTIVHIPVVFPPAVAGIGLLLSFGRNGMVGSLLERYNIEITFTPIAVIIAQFFVSSVFYVQILKTAVDKIPSEICEASYVFGAGKVQTVLKVILPMSKKAVISGLILSWIRALGEFGATIMFAGNILYKTRTIPLQIYTLMQTDIETAAAFSAILFILSFCTLLVVKNWIWE